MPLANKEVVHLKTGWEKIQVRVLLFTTLFFYTAFVRSFLSLSLSLSSFFFLLCVCMFTKKMQQQQQQNEIGKNGDLSSLGTDFEMCVTRLLTSLSLSLSL